MTPPETRLLLVRHGETDANVNRVWQGSGEGDLLNERGQRQSQATAEHLATFGPTRAVYTSPIPRARQTAEIIAQRLGAPLGEIYDLREYDLGVMEGLSPEEVSTQWADFVKRWENDPDLAPPGGESPRQFATRVVLALRAIIEECAGCTAVVVSHQGTLAVGLSVLLGIPDRWRDYEMANCALSTLAIGGEVHLIQFNDTTHLADIGTEVWQGTVEEQS